MNLHHKILITWLLFFIPIFFYGFFEMSKPNDKGKRWWMLGGWSMMFFLIELFFVWTIN